MWSVDGQEFARDHGLPPRLVKHLQCTAEHLLPREDGGQDIASNIVAACRWCNKMRHQSRRGKAPDPLSYRSKVLGLIGMKRWHPLVESKNAELFSKR